VLRLDPLAREFVFTAFFAILNCLEPTSFIMRWLAAFDLFLGYVNVTFTLVGKASSFTHELSFFSFLSIHRAQQQHSKCIPEVRS